MSKRRGSKHNLCREEWRAAPHAYTPRGMALPQTKLMPLDIGVIRAAAARREQMRQEIRDSLSNEALARRFGVHVRTIEKALTRETHIQIL